ncbi:MAG: polysaccharide pyruvyl transferase family protein [Rivularia sp. ALOHA_DT_140]|nr:polysaccharide pyruvyl transferase family protein [Rivularia sp. ALOHA_DT_140]
MKIAIITTVNHNVGDDFVREGIIYLLKQRFPEENLFIQNIHKHSPITSRYGFEWFRNLRVSRHVEKYLPLKVTKDRILEADLLVQSGAPIYWCHPGESHCADNEWFDPLIRRRYKKIKQKAPFINLAGGSCQRYHSDGDEFISSQKDIDYVKEFYDFAKVTTVRDTLAKNILNSLSLDAPVIPCSSIFARNNLAIEPETPSFVALNYMRGGAHFSFGQNISPDEWEKTFREFYQKIKNQEKCIFVCHNQAEVKEAKKIDPNANIFISKDYIDYIKLYAKAKFGIMNRVHGAFMLGSFGRPSFVIGTDSRACMAEEIGLRHAFVNDVDANRLMLEYQYMKDGANNFEERFSNIKAKAYQDYQLALSQL